MSYQGEPPHGDVPYRPDGQPPPPPAGGVAPYGQAPGHTPYPPPGSEHAGPYGPVGPYTGASAEPQPPGYDGYGAPGYGVPGHGTASYGVPAHGTASYGVPGHGTAGYGVPGYAPGPYGPVPVDPYTGRPLSPKSKVAAGLLQIFLGMFGVGRFYMGSTGIAVVQLVLTIVGWATSWLGIGIVIVFGVVLWALIDGIVILAGRPTDGEGRDLH